MGTGLTLSAFPGVSLADKGEEPDLKIEVLGLKSGSKRDVQLRVTNISDWWSDRTEAIIELDPAWSAKIPPIDIQDMNTKDEAPLPYIYDFVYTLPVDCDGHKLKVTLSAGANYMGDKEIALGNNKDEKALCQKGGSAASVSPSSSNIPARPLPAGVTAPTLKVEKVTPGTTGPARVDVEYIDPPVQNSNAPGGLHAFMARVEPGTHTDSFSIAASMRRGVEATFHGGFAAAECFPVSHSNLEPKFIVGWGEYEWFGSRCMKYLYQVAIAFDKGPLAGLQPSDYRIDRAVLAYDEVEMFFPFCNGVVLGMGLEDPDVESVCWRSGDGKHEARPNGCVVVRMPSAEWRGAGRSGLVPFVSGPGAPNVRQASPREWDVTEAYRWQTVPSSRPLTAPGGTAAAPGFGFLLTGGADFNELQGEDSTSCISHVTNVRLNVTYTVFEDGPGPIVK
jgi:hypothetical protein